MNLNWFVVGILFVFVERKILWMRN